VKEQVARFSILHQGWKLIHTPAAARTELYDLGSDPGELRDLAAAEPGHRDALLEALVRGYDTAQTPTPGAFMEDNAEALQRLRELGYIGPEGGGLEGGEPGGGR
jgi:arylsulfatase A-like enzyme